MLVVTNGYFIKYVPRIDGIGSYWVVLGRIRRILSVLCGLHFISHVV
jgi:hypothetical protein